MTRLWIATLALVLAGAAAAGSPRRDPFARPAPPPAKVEAPAEPAPQLRAIVFAPGHSLADIDGHILAEGESIGAYLLVRIDERSVTLARGGTRSVLALDREGNR